MPVAGVGQPGKGHDLLVQEGAAFQDEAGIAGVDVKAIGCRGAGIASGDGVLRLGPRGLLQ